jgi:hypothetical protein
MGYGADWDETWAKEQRVCSHEYFQRYFTYSVPNRDVPDLAIGYLIEAAGKDKKDEVASTIRKYADKRALEKFVQKLRQRETTIEPQASKLLAVVIAEMGSLLPRDKAMYMSDRAFMQAAILVAHLIERLSSEAERIDLARYVMKVADPLPFAFECLRWIRTDKESKSSQAPIVPEVVEQEIGEHLANRISEGAKESCVYRRYGSDAPALLWAWGNYGNPDHARTHISLSLNHDPQNVIHFLATYIGISWEINSGIPRKSDLPRDVYDAIAKLIDPAIILNHLRAIFGTKLDNPEYHHSDETPFDEKIAQQFAYIHISVIAEKAKNGLASVGPISSIN